MRKIEVKRFNVYDFEAVHKIQPNGYDTTFTGFYVSTLDSGLINTEIYRLSTISTSVSHGSKTPTVALPVINPTDDPEYFQ
jgi:hypothetical protein